MHRGFMKTKARLALLAAAGVTLGVPAATAADLGGNCCADLEERIAELEATTARKGNRKVSLTVYGQVNEAVMFWDDGVENNAYVVTNDNARTRFGFKGSAKITDAWKAGYQLEIGVRGASSKRFNQDSAVEDSGLDIRHSRWFIESKELGTVHVGVTPTAMEAATETNLAHTKDIAKYSDVEDSGLGLYLRTANGLISTGSATRDPVQWRRLIKHTGDQPGEGERRPGVWYVSPSWNGLNLEAGWGADDHWDVGAKYKGEAGDFEIAAAVAYGETTDGLNSNDFSNFFECTGTDVIPGSDADCRQAGGSISVMHKPTGIYVNFAGGWHEDETVLFDSDIDGTNASNESWFWAVEGGVEQKFNSLGKTTLFGQYYDFDGGASERLTVGVGDPINPFATEANVFSSALQMWGGGIVQELSAASMLLYAYYRHYEADLTLVHNDVVMPSVPLDDLDVVVSGAIIKF